MVEFEIKCSPDVFLSGPNRGGPHFFPLNRKDRQKKEVWQSWKSVIFFYWFTVIFT